jgi:hypothetical protein
VRIRHFGFLANRNRHQRISLCRQLLAAEPFQRCTPTAETKRCQSDLALPALRQIHANTPTLHRQTASPPTGSLERRC